MILEGRARVMAVAWDLSLAVEPEERIWMGNGRIRFKGSLVG